MSTICESAVRLINKVGKLPKDRLCKQEIGIAEENVNAFLCLWVKFIDIFIEVCILYFVGFAAIEAIHIIRMF